MQAGRRAYINGFYPTPSPPSVRVVDVGGDEIDEKGGKEQAVAFLWSECVGVSTTPPLPRGDFSWECEFSFISVQI